MQACHGGCASFGGAWHAKHGVPCRPTSGRSARRSCLPLTSVCSCVRSDALNRCRLRFSRRLSRLVGARRLRKQCAEGQLTEAAATGGGGDGGSWVERGERSGRAGSHLVSAHLISRPVPTAVSATAVAPRTARDLSMLTAPTCFWRLGRETIKAMQLAMAGLPPLLDCPCRLVSGAAPVHHRASEQPLVGRLRIWSIADCLPIPPAAAAATAVLPPPACRHSRPLLSPPLVCWRLFGSGFVPYWA